jgi:hypothetical protein
MCSNQILNFNFNLTDSDKISFLTGLYHRTNNCIHQTTNLMNYHLPSLNETESTYSEKFLLKWIDKFQPFFEPKNQQWRKQILESTKISAQEKIKGLLKYIKLSNSRSFIFYVRNMSAAFVAEKLRIMDAVTEIITQCPETHLSEIDKLGYTRLSLVKLISHLFNRSMEPLDGPTFEKIEERIIVFARELCQANCSSPEPYFFLILLIWPFYEEDEKKHLVKFWIINFSLVLFFPFYLNVLSKL